MVKSRNYLVAGVICGLIFIGTSVSAATLKGEYTPKTPKITKGSITSQAKVSKEEFISKTKKGDKVTYLAGETTKGSEIVINGKKIKLPADTYLG